MAQANAWILQFGKDIRAAVGQRELLHLDQHVSNRVVDIIDSSDSSTVHQGLLRYTVPLAPAYCCEVLLWQGQFIPLMNLAMRLSNTSKTMATEVCEAAPCVQALDPPEVYTIESANTPLQPRYIGIFGYVASLGGATNYGAIWLTHPPHLVRVNDAQKAQPSDISSSWLALASIGFSDDAGAVPVLDLTRIFAAS